MAQLYVSIEKFNFEASSLKKEWKRFSSEFQSYLIINGLKEKSEEIKLNYLKLLMGYESVNIINNLLLTEAEKQSLEKVLEALQNYFSPKTNFFIERLKLRNRVQKEGESVEKFINSVQTQAEDCEFNNFKEEAIRDQILFGLKNQNLREKIILSEEKSLHAVISKIKVFHHNQQQLRELSADKASVSQKSDFIHHKQTTTSSVKTSQVIRNYEDESLIGAKKKEKVIAVDERVNSKSAKTINCDMLNRDGKNIWYKKLLVHDKMVNFKLDTGSQVNTISVDIFKSLGKKFKIEKSNILLKSYFGEVNHPVGKTVIPIKMNNNIFLEEFVIIGKKTEPLLGLESCINLKLISRLDSLQLNQLLCSEKQKDKFTDYYKKAFTGLGKFEKPLKLKLKENAIPVANQNRRIPFKLKNKLRNKLNEMEALGIISRVHEQREWINSIVVVEKGDKIRICIDPKHLNQSLNKFHFPIPSLEELKQDLKDSKYFSVLDLKDGFWHIELDEESKKLCTFSSPFGLWQFNRLPFGINIASEIFQKYMTDNFGDLPGVKFYIDDIIVTGKTLKEHDENLGKLMVRALAKGVKFNEKKLQFTQSSVKFFGHIFSMNSVQVDPERISAIDKIPNPKNIEDVQKFLGVVNYIRDFIPNLPSLTVNIRNLLKKDSEFLWLENHQAEFDNIKDVIKNVTACTTFDENMPIILETDASSYGLGACLKQGDKIISFASRCLSDTEKDYGQIEKEFLAVFFACKKFHNYIYGRKVTVISDHRPLESIINKDISKIGSKRLQRIRLKLHKYDIELKYKSGKSIPVADYLSRYVSGKTSNNFEENFMKQMVHSVNISDDKLKVYQDETDKDSECSLLKKYFAEGWPSDKSKVADEVKFYFKMRNEIYVSDDLVYYQDRIIIPKSLREKVLVDLHEGHMGITKTLRFAKESVYWPSLNVSIENLINSCEECNKFQRSNKKEPIIQHEIPLRSFEKVGCDILEFNGKNYLVVMDYFSKWISCKYLSSKNSSTVISKFIEIFTEHGFPKTIIADNMPFNSFECRSFAQEWDINIVTSSPHYAQSNGLAEKAVGIVKNMMKKCIDFNRVLVAIYNYNNTPLADIDLSPSQLLNNRRMRTKIIMKDSLLKPKINHNLGEKFDRKQQKTKFYYNRNAYEREDFDLNQKVWVQLPNNTWSKGLIVNKCSEPRSYEVCMDNNRILRRNSKFLRVDKSVSNQINHQKCINSEQYRINLDNYFAEESLHDLPLNSNANITSSISQQPSTSMQNISNQPLLRRSSRIPKPVQRLGAS